VDSSYVLKVRNSSQLTNYFPSAPTKAASQESVGYDVYDLFDLGEFDQKGASRTKWGTKEELITAIKTARDHGIVTYVDAVLNHR
jgi:alpha-amylase